MRALAPASVSDWAVAHANGVDPRAAGMLKAVAILGPGAELRHVAGLARLDSEQAATIADSLIESGLLSAHEPLSFSQPVVAHGDRCSPLAYRAGDSSPACLADPGV